LSLKGRFLCTIYVPKLVYVVYRSRYNFEFDREFNSPNVVGVVKSNRLHYAGRMIRGVVDLPQIALVRAVPEGKRNQVDGWREQQ
jgi:hypothetical protein